ncbi:hypothetical protein C0Q70_10227 [Pomacea canaliculata]|uniref:FHA domain-containing protein n=1 Tax=Pomacea canaliculata TaxID=400727 RepID=A0A2T7PC09_POMCA|nr:hypothetical protein C0Q70_10227 [Pomacea canaliculata]
MYGKIVVIKRNGADGAHFPLINTSCWFGRSNECDIRIQLPSVSREHCKLDVNSEGQVFVSNVSNITPTQINKKELTDPQLLEHGDLITIVDRSFRFEFPPDSKYHPNNEKLPCSSKELDLQKSISQKVLSPESQPAALADSKQSPVTPLSLRSQNVMTTNLAVVSPKKTPTSGRAQNSSTGKPETKSNPLDDLLDGLSPTSFYKTTPPRALKGARTVSKDQTTPGNQEETFLSSRSCKSPLRKSSELPARSPHLSPKGSRKITSNRRRKSQPSFEENVSPPKKKRVSFGPNLSPEQFDKTLPPKTPVKKGAMPRKSFPLVMNTPHSVLKRRSVAVTILEESSARISPSQGTDSDGLSLTKSKSPAHGRSNSPGSLKKTTVSGASTSPFYPKGSPAIVKKTITSQELPDYNSSNSCLPARGHDLLQQTVEKTTTRRQSRSSHRHYFTATSPDSVENAASNGEEALVSLFQDQRTPRTATKNNSSALARSSLQNPLEEQAQAGITRNIPDALLNYAVQNITQDHTPKNKIMQSPVAEHTPLLQQTSLELKTASRLEQSSPCEFSLRQPRAQSKSPTRTPVSADPVISHKSPRTSQRESFITSKAVLTLKNTAALEESRSSRRSQASNSTVTKSVTPSPTGIMKTSKRPLAACVSPTGIVKLMKTPKVPKSMTPSPTGIKRIMKTPKRPLAACVSPTGVARLMKTPKVAKCATHSPSGIKRLLRTPLASKPVAITSPNLTGLKRLMKTPRQTAATAASPVGVARLTKTPEDVPTVSITPSPSGIKELLQTPKGADSGAITTPSPNGIKRALKTPKPTRLSSGPTPSPVGLIELMETPRAARSAIAATPAGSTRLRTPSSSTLVLPDTPHILSSAVISSNKVKTPGSAAEKVRKSLRSSRSNKLMKTPNSVNKGLADISGVAELFKTPRTSDSLSSDCTSAKSKDKTLVNQVQATKMVSPVGRLMTAFTDPNKMVALKTIHQKKTWSDVVKNGLPAESSFKPMSSTMRKMVTRRKTSSQVASQMVKRTGKSPKTPRTLTRLIASSTGHVDSPETLVVGKMVSKGRPTKRRTTLVLHQAKTTQPVVSSMEMNVSFTGVKELFQTPPAYNTEEALYADIPDTPGGPGEMIVSPLSNKKGGGQSSARKGGRRSAVLVGIRHLFHSTKVSKEPRLSGVRRLVATPRNKQKVSPSLAGITRLLRTPKVKIPAVLSPSGIQCIFATPTNSTSLPVAKRKKSYENQLFAQPSVAEKITEAKHQKVAETLIVDAHEQGYSMSVPGSSEIIGKVSVTPNSAHHDSPLVSTPKQQGLQIAAEVEIPADPILSASVQKTAAAITVITLNDKEDPNFLPSASTKGRLRSSLRTTTRVTSSNAVSNFVKETDSEVSSHVLWKVSSVEMPSLNSKKDKYKSRSKTAANQIQTSPKSLPGLSEETVKNGDLLIHKVSLPDVSSFTEGSQEKVASTPVRGTRRRVTLITPAKINFITPAPLKRRGRSKAILMSAFKEPSAIPQLDTESSFALKPAGRKTVKDLPGKMLDITESAQKAIDTSFADSSVPKSASRIKNGGITQPQPDTTVAISAAPSPIKLKGRQGERLHVNIAKSSGKKKNAASKHSGSLTELEVSVPTKNQQGASTEVLSNTTGASPVNTKRDLRSKTAESICTTKSLVKKGKSRQALVAAQIGWTAVLQSEGFTPSEIVCAVETSPVPVSKKTRLAKKALVKSSTASLEVAEVPALQSEASQASEIFPTQASKGSRRGRRGQANSSLAALVASEMDKTTVLQSQNIKAALAPKRGRAKKQADTSVMSTCTTEEAEVSPLQIEGLLQAHNKQLSTPAVKRRRTKKGQDKATGSAGTANICKMQKAGLLSETTPTLEPSPAAPVKRKTRTKVNTLFQASSQKGIKSRLRSKLNQPETPAPLPPYTSGRNRSASTTDLEPPTKQVAIAKSKTPRVEGNRALRLQRNQMGKSKEPSPIKSVARKSKQEVSTESRSPVQRGKRKTAPVLKLSSPKRKRESTTDLEPPSKRVAIAKSETPCVEGNRALRLQRNQMGKSKKPSPVKSVARKSKQEVSTESHSPVQRGKRKTAPVLNLSSPKRKRESNAKTADKSNREAVTLVAIRHTRRSKASRVVVPSATVPKKRGKK